DDHDGRLLLYQPDKILPRIAGPAADALLRRDVRRAMRRIGMARPVLWVNDPSWAGMVARSDAPSLYDMTDDWLAADRDARERRRLVACEEILLTRCTTVVVCSDGLYATRSQRRQVVLIPNAVDVQRYRTPHPRPIDLAERSALYLGTLHEDRLDLGLVLQTADALSTVGGKLVLVGPNALSAENTSRLAGHTAITLLGSRPWTVVPAYLQHASVLVVPHVVDGFTDSLDPIKLYEYRAVGRPVVSTPVAGFRDDPGVRVGDAATFPALVVAALDDAAPPREDRLDTPPPDVPTWRGQ